MRALSRVSSSSLKLGLIGAGRWGKNIIRTLANMENVSLHRLASNNPISKELVDHNCTISSNWQDLIEAEDLDGLIIASPPETHTKIALQALSSRLPLFIEKPMTMNIGEAHLIVDAANASKTMVFIDHIHLFHKSYRLLKSFIPKLNGIREIKSWGGNEGPFRQVSPLWDWGPHEFALISDLAGQNGKIITASLLKEKTHVAGPGQLIKFEMEFPSGIRAMSTFGNLMETKMRRLEVECHDGTLIMDDLTDHPLILLRDGFEEIISVQKTQPLNAALEAFCHCLTSDDENPCNAEDGAEVVKLISSLESYLIH